MSPEKLDLHYTTTSKIEEQGKITEKIEQKIVNINPGFLGKIFGSAENAPTNICGFVLVLLILIAIPVIFLNSKIDAYDYLNTIIPVITLVFGYFFGKGSR